MERIDWQERYHQLARNPEETVRILEENTGKTSPLKINPEFVPVLAFGAWAFNHSLEGFLDFSAGISSINWGHNNLEISKAKEWCRGNLIPNIPPNTWPNPLAAVLTERLCAIMAERFPKNAYKVFYTVGGSNAVDDAIKRVLDHAKASRRHVALFAFDHAFHGRGGLPLILHDSNEVHRRYFLDFWDRAIHIQFPVMGHDCAEYAARELPLIQKLVDHHTYNGERCAALFGECVQGEGGTNVGCFTCLPLAVKMFQNAGHLFIDDEIQMGLGRTGKMFACEHYGIVPDMITLGKSFSSDANLSACIFRAPLDFEDYGRNSATGPAIEGFATALAGLDILEDLMQTEMFKRGEEILKDAFPNGLGWVWRIDCESPEQANEFYHLALTHKPVGLITLKTGQQSIRFTPPLTISETDLRMGIAIVNDVKAQLGIK